MLGEAGRSRQRGAQGRSGGRRTASRLLLVLALPLLGACALHSDVTRVQRQLEAMRQREIQRDSALASAFAGVARGLQAINDSLAAQSAIVTRLRGDVGTEMYNVQQQLVAIQELTGQSQQRLSELRRALDQRSAQIAAAPAADTARRAAPDTAGPAIGELMDLSLQQLRRGSPGTARAGFAEALRRFPEHPRAADAEYFTGEAWNAEQRADSAAAAYRRVTQRWPQSARAASAWYKLGLIALAQGRTNDARTAFTRVVNQYPTSEEAALARERLRSLPSGR